MSQTVIRWPEVLTALLHGEDLEEQQAADVMAVLMRGEAETAQVAALLVALRAKGESAPEIAGFVRAMLDAAEPLDVPTALRDSLVDIVGTGGDAAGTFNISTIAALVVAAAGVPVAKHGNRAASSRCGSADLLEGWGLDLSLPTSSVTACLQELGITFLYARAFHPAMRLVAPVRQDLGIRTVFNVLGPLSNPAGAPHQAVGVAELRLAPVMAEALARLGKRHALVFRGEDGLDELTTTGTNRVWEVRDGDVSEFVLDPRELGIDRVDPEQLRGGDVADNVRIADAILAGETGPKADVVVLNAAAGLYAADAVEDLSSGIVRARTVLADGTAAELKRQWVSWTAAHAPGRAHG